MDDVNALNDTGPAVDYKDEALFKKLSKAEQWRVMASKGDVRALLDVMSRGMPGVHDYSDLAACLQIAIETLARDNPAAFAQFLRTEIMAAAGKLVTRASLVLRAELRGQFGPSPQCGAWSPRDGYDKFAASIMAIHLHVARLQQIDANTQRVLEQTRKLRLANDKAEKKNRPGRPARRQRHATTRPQTPAPASRIAGELP